MKISKTDAVEFFVDLGWEKARDWDNATLLERLQKVPDKVKEEDVSAKFKPLYKTLVEGNGAIELDAPAEAKADKKKDKPAKDSKDKPKADKPEKKDKPAKAEKDSKDAKPAKAKKEKKEKPAKEEVERDQYGAAVGTIRSKVNAAFSKEWKGEDEICEEAGVEVKQARIRLHKAIELGVLERRRRIEYRLVPAKK